MKTVAQTVIEADHFYTIAAHTGNVIQAVEGTKEAGTVRLGKYEHKPEQEWSFIRVGDGVYRIRNRASGKLLDLTMTGTANGTWLHLWEDVGGTSQMWTVQPTPEGTVRLRSSWAGGKCVDTVGMGAAVGTVLQIGDCTVFRKPEGTPVPQGVCLPDNRFGPQAVLPIHALPRLFQHWFAESEQRCGIIALQVGILDGGSLLE